jgi:hypothetical protein
MVDRLAGDGPGDTNGSLAEADEPFPTVGTPEWGRMNQRRAELIRKKVRAELTEAERQQYEWLQRKSLEALDAAHPRTRPGNEPG